MEGTLKIYQLNAETTVSAFGQFDISFWNRALHLLAEDWGSVFLQNVGIYLHAHTTLQPRI